MLIRRSAVAAFCLLILSAANVAAAAKTVSINASTFAPASVTVAMGGSVKWANKTAKKHTVVSDAVFLWGTLTVKAHKTSTALHFMEAGSFPYHDSLSPAHGTVVVPMTADAAYVSVGSTVTLTLGTAPLPAAVVHIVQARVNGGAWMQVMSAQPSTYGVKLNTVGKWEFQTYLRQALSGWNSGTSPMITVTVS